MKPTFKSIFGILFLTYFTTVGCDVMQSSTDEASAVQVSMRVQSAGTLAKSPSGSVQDSPGLSLTEVKLFLDELELESATEDSLDFELEYQVINLPLDGMPLILTRQSIPAGRYDEFEMEIERPDTDDDYVVTDADFNDETGSYSVVVRGTYNGTPFLFRSREDFELEIELEPELVITGDETSAELTIAIDLSSWFVDANGNTIDPSDPANLGLINNNIERSFDAFEDRYDDDDDDDDDD